VFDFLTCTFTLHTQRGCLNSRNIEINGILRFVQFNCWRRHRCNEIRQMAKHPV